MNSLTIKRIIADKRNIDRNPLDSFGIYISFDEEDIYSAQALIIGPSETPYHNGYYLFSITFPTNYPFTPPKVVLRTLDPSSHIRLNPNLYTCGKVCLSILNTWSGPKWTSCQNLSSVLVSIQSILNENPIHNEPGWENETGSISTSYNNIITHENFNIAIINIIKHIPYGFEMFLPIIREHFINNFSNIEQRINKLIGSFKDNTIEKSKIYSLTTKYKYTTILQKIRDIYHSYTEFEPPQQLNKKEQILLTNEDNTVMEKVILTNEDKEDIKNEIEEINQKIIKKKYSRKGPNSKAKIYDIGYITKSENDNNNYIVSIDKNNVKRWKKYHLAINLQSITI